MRSPDRHHLSKPNLAFSRFQGSHKTNMSGPTRKTTLSTFRIRTRRSGAARTRRWGVDLARFVSRVGRAALEKLRDKT